MSIHVHALRAFAILALCAGCGSGIEALSDWERAADFREYQTFKIGDLQPDAPAGLSRRANPRPEIIEAANEAIVAALTAKGLRQEENAQLVVTINGGRRERTQTTNQPGSVANPYAGSYVQSYEEGTLIIDIYDANRNMLVWHGWARAKVDGEVSTELVVEAVQKILERFPPQES